jgi:hypothetical protein
MKQPRNSFHTNYMEPHELQRVGTLNKSQINFGKFIQYILIQIYVPIQQSQNLNLTLYIEHHVYCVRIMYFIHMNIFSLSS